MGSISLRQLLRSLCHNSQWEYAVFWKLKHRNRMFLTWEDGYCEYPRPKGSTQGVSDSASCSEKIEVASFESETSIHGGISAAHPIGLAVASMSCLLYSLGDGFIGRVASTGKHCWIFADEFNSKLLSEYPDEWQLQFAVGIKTILLVPVVPHGVVQLGSLVIVPEDPTFLSHVKDIFNTLQCIPRASLPSTFSRDLPHASSSSLTSSLLENLAKPSSNDSDILEQHLSDLKEKDSIALDGVQKTQSPLSTMNWDIRSCFIGQVQENDASEDADFGSLLMVPAAASFPENDIPNGSHSRMTVPETPHLSTLEDELQSYSQSNFMKSRFASQNNMTTNFFSSSDIIYQQLEYETSKETDWKSFHGLLNFPADCELHKALGPAFQKICTEYGPINSGDDSNSSVIYHTDVSKGSESTGDFSGWFLGGGDAGSLLDAVVSTSGDIAFNRFSSINSPTHCQTQSPSRCNFAGDDHLESWSSVKSSFVSQQGSSSESSLKSMASKMIDDEQQKKDFGHLKSKKGTKLPHFSHKKARVGDVERPKQRPRDRQMIQDRVKELRELVPNGAKCSIDALLDQTIKHMLFLRSVTTHAEKLKLCVYQEVDSKKCLKSSETQGQPSGESWAFEVGSQFGVCPIVVKDLDQPGHMLIEMLCEDHDLFLEIAQVIGQLKLTILKGVLEDRLGNKWAHFVVEVSAGFERMDIFWPLMQLLQRNNLISKIIRALCKDRVSAIKVLKDGRNSL